MKYPLLRLLDKINRFPFSNFVNLLSFRMFLARRNRQEIFVTGLRCLNNTVRQEGICANIINTTTVINGKNCLLQFLMLKKSEQQVHDYFFFYLGGKKREKKG